MLKYLKEKRGLLAFTFETITLYSLIYLFSLLFKVLHTSYDELGTEYLAVNPIIGALSIVFVFCMALLHANEFYNVQKKYKESGKKKSLIISWFLYVIYVILMVVVAFFTFIFRIKEDILYSYFFKDEFLNNFMFFGIFGILMPLSYFLLYLRRKSKN